MNRRFLALTALSLTSFTALAGCGGSETNSAPAVTPAPSASEESTTSSAAMPTTTGAPVTATNPLVAKYINGALASLGLSVADRQCAAERADAGLAQSPANAEQAEFVAGVVAGATNGCAGKPVVITALGASLKSEGKYSDTQIACVEKELTAFDDEKLGTFVAYSLVGANAELKPMKQAIDTACGTKTDD